MPHDRDEWIRQIKAIEREHLAAQFAIKRLVNAVEVDPLLLEGPLKLRDLRRTSENLDGTYLIRLFATFESGLRLYWGTLKNTKPTARDLLEAVAARRNIPEDASIDVQAVREHRNALVHESVADLAILSVSLARFVQILQLPASQMVTPSPLRRSRIGWRFLANFFSTLPLGPVKSNNVAWGGVY